MSKFVGAVLTEASNLSFAEGRVVKYLLRHKQKGGVENLKKAKHYINLMITTQYGSNECHLPKK